VLSDRGSSKGSTAVRRIISGRALAVACLAATTAFGIALATPAHAAVASYYVDCTSGSDSNAGTSATSPWKTITKLNKAALQPGDTALLARGCVWTGTQLTARWAGTPTAPITIGAYGSGALPTIKSSGFANVKVTGSYQIVQDLMSTFDPVTKDPCGQPLGQYYGVTFTGGAHDNTLRRVTSTAATAGVHLGKASSANHIVGNQLIGNNVLQSFNDSTPADDLGAWGIIVNGNDNEVAYNTFKNNAAVCTMPGQWLMSNSIEIYEGSHNSIHHNKSFGDRVFSELGGGSVVKATGNRYFYNVYSSARPDSRFIVTRGAGSAYGPVNGTVLNHNTSYQTGLRSQGIVCELSCGPTILSVSGSIIWAEEKVVYADATFDFSNSLIWSSNGVPVVQIKTKPVFTNVVIANPMFTNPPTGTFTLQPTSAAIDADLGVTLSTKDLNNVSVPLGLRPDFGSYELLV
jgi:hypothetical protein